MPYQLQRNQRDFIIKIFCYKKEKDTDVSNFQIGQVRKVRKEYENQTDSISFTTTYSKPTSPARVPSRILGRGANGSA